MSEQGEPIKVELPDGTRMVFQHIPAGSFRMGQRGEAAREEPVTEIFVEEFWIGETLVTQAQYRAMAQGCAEELAAIEGNGGAEPSHFKGDQMPVEQVSWDDARVVAKWLTDFMEKEQLLPEGYVADLPWEDQWEYACRAGSETDYHSGDGEAALPAAGWYGGNAEGKTHEVARLKPNHWGLFDMHGNILEWCRDVPQRARYRLQIPGELALESPEGEGHRVLRGGSWDLTAWGCRSAYRLGLRPGRRDRNFGFRLALVPGPVPDQSGGPEARERAEPGAATEEAGDPPDQTLREGGATFAEAPAAEADLNANFPPRSGGDFSPEKQDDDGTDE